MALDPDFIKRIQEKKAKREALEQKYEHSNRTSTRRSSGSGGGGGGRRKTGPVYRSVSMLDGHAVTITGEDAQKRKKKSEYKG